MGHDMCCGIFIVLVYTTRVRARVCIRLLLNRLSQNIVLLTIGIKDYVLFMFTHRAHAFVYLWTDVHQICGENTTNHNK
jgi:hypothetical protein